MTGYQSKKKAAQDKLVMTPEQKKIYEDGFLAGQEQLIKSSVHRAVHGLAQPAQPHCQCSACKDGKLHLSDCAVHNEPAYPAGPCDCGVLNQQIAQPAQEPKSVTYKEVADTMNALRKGNFSQQAAAKEVGKLKLYTTPPQRTWVGLTEEEILDVNMSTVKKLIDEPIVCDTDHNIIQLGKAIEAKFKQKNGFAEENT
jgi:hypothetical protein